MQEIRLKENITIDDINGWISIADNDLVFEILHKSSFQLFSEGVALATLRELNERGKKIYIKFFKGPDLENSEFQPILETIFGLELLRIAQATIDNSFIISNTHTKVGKTIWGSVLDQGGYIGDGKKAYLFSRHDYDIPRCIRNMDEPSAFPRFDYFKNNVSNLLLKMRGFSNHIGDHELNLIEWLHHIGENAHEHGSYSFVRNSPTEGFRGITLGKLIFKTAEEVSIRNDYPDFLTKHILALIQGEKTPNKGIIFNYASVIDCGDGIQNTTPNPDKLSAVELISSAFNDGVTRKNISMNESSGYGLGQSLVAASNLHAIFHLTSGDVEIINAATALSENTIKLHQNNSLSKSTGTTASILWLNENQILEGDD
jgi:hypothetical protein